jgi:AraC family transcriptional regulator, transcriptional activator of pobA
MIYKGENNAYFLLSKVTEFTEKPVNELALDSLSLLWIKNNGTVIEIDGSVFTFLKNQLLFLSNAHQVKYIVPNDSIILQFNPTFYNVIHNDEKLLCSGLLYHSALPFPIISVSKHELDRFQNIWQMVLNQNSNLGLMQMMILQLLVLCRQLYIEQKNWKSISRKKIDTLRRYCFLVNQHFREKHLVSDYACLLGKSPKTLSNTFADDFNHNPLQIIHNRILLEAKRVLLLHHQSVDSVATQLGFKDVASFSRFFKNKTGISPTEFRSSLHKYNSI